MIKFYKTLKEYAEAEWVSEKTASRRLKNQAWIACIPKKVKYYEVDRNAVIQDL